MAQGKQDAGKKPTAKTHKARFNDVVFVQRELSADETLACKNQVASLDVLENSVLSLCDRGYRISLKWDDYGECYGAWMQQTEASGENAGMCLAGRGSTPIKALKQVLFKHFVLLEESWEEFKEVRKGIEIDD